MERLFEMNRFILVVMLAASLWLGCKKKETTTPQPQTGAPAETSVNPSTPEEAAATPAPVPTVPKSTKPPPPPRYVTANADNILRQNVVGDVDSFLTGQLRIFVQKKNRMPDTFSEFVSARIDSMPRAPEGKRWVIDSSTIEVKAVATK